MRTSMKVEIIGPSQIGNAREVQAILRSKDKRPKGWTFIDSGSTRKVYVSPDRQYVYKVNYRKDDYNAKEFENVGVFRSRFPDNIPPATLYTSGSISIIAMPYFPIEWDYRSSYGPLQDIRDKIGLPDMGVYNIRVGDKGQPVLIDLGVFSDDNSNSSADWGSGW